MIEPRYCKSCGCYVPDLWDRCLACGSAQESGLKATDRPMSHIVPPTLTHPQAPPRPSSLAKNIEQLKADIRELEYIQYFDIHGRKIMTITTPPAPYMPTKEER